ncbi:transcriptional regulator, PadR family [Nocardioides scoriae]|uniref:Transcriptional regulator, PadR family n=1 Tax=Nocardioides scoriae TaxID=642780 RepID=A0A1H1SJN4_9ACTN|nr:PadR family transcriptional regulator [Nocardioides scoriae]SDS47559.1 transcriptional regulator, PadR family [Nocardioides scoriae]
MDLDPQMLKGVLGMLLLRLLDAEEGYGYAVVVRLREAGVVGLAEGTVYPALTRLEAAGHLSSRLVRSSSGPARKYYRTTPAGREALATREASWQLLRDAVERVGTRPDQEVPA